MPRKSTADDLKAEEAAAPNSPLRRSSRIVIGNATAPAGTVARKSFQSSNSQENIPARATRSRRASAQDSEEIAEVVKPITKTRRASMLAEEEIQKETSSTPTRRTRKPSTESTEKEELEKPKPVRGRRNSSSTTEEPEKPQNLASVRTRRSSASIEPEVEVKVTTKTPARTTRRRNSATENAVTEEVSTPAKRTTRGRKPSDTDDNDIKEEVKKPTTRGRKKSVTSEEDERNEEPIKPAVRKSRRRSTDDSSDNAASKTSGKLENRQLVPTKEADSEDASKDSSAVQKLKSIQESSNSDEELLAKVLSGVATQVTPLKKRKILEKMEELDLSIINESSGDISNSKHDVSSESVENKKKDHEEEMSPMVLKDVFINITPLKKRKVLDKLEDMDLSVINESSDDIDNVEHNKGSKITESEQCDNKQADEDLVDGPLNTTSHAYSVKREESPNRSLKSEDETHVDTSKLKNKSPNTPTKKRLSSEIDDNPPRKSPRLSEKSFNSPKKQGDHDKAPTPRNSRNLMKETEKELSVELNEKTLPSFVSSGSDGSFRFHLTNVSITNSDQYDSNKETSQEDVLNTSTGSNKENIEQVDSSNVSKAVLDVTNEIPTQKPIAATRVSNVFKPNQKDCSFMEPMEVDEDSVIYVETSLAETNKTLDSSSILNQKTAEKVSSSVEISNDQLSSDSNEASVIFNYRASVKRTVGKSDEKSTPASPNQRSETVSILEHTNISLKQSLTETEGSDNNLLIEETHDTVNFSIKPKTEKPNSPTSETIIAQKNACPSPARVDASLIINQPLEQLKVVLTGKSSSPITRRKSKSPVAKTGDIPNSGSEVCETLTVPRRSKSKSKSPSPRRDSVRSPSFLTIDLDNRGKSKKSMSPAAQDNKMPQSQSDRARSKSPRPRRSAAKSPSCLCVDVAVNARKSNSPHASEVGKKISTPVTHEDSPKRLTESKPKDLTELDEIPIVQVKDKLTHRRSIRSMSKSPLPESVFLDQSYEKPKGTEEILVTNIKKSKELDEILEKEAQANDQDINLKHLSDSVAADTCKTTQTQLEMSDINITESESTHIQDKTEYHTAVASTNNESAFTSMLTDNEVSESNIKPSESPHYDFDLDSDADLESDLMDSKDNTSVTSVGNKQALTSEEELKNRSHGVAELKKSFRKSINPENDKSDELSEQCVKADGASGDPDGHTSSTKNDSGLIKETQESDLKEQCESEELVIDLNAEKEDTNNGKNDTVCESGSVSVDNLPVTDIAVQKNIDEQSMLPENNTDQNDMYQVDIKDEEDSADLRDNLSSSEKKRRVPTWRDANEEVQLKTSSRAKKVSREEDNVVNDETEQKNKKNQKQNVLDSSRNSDDMKDKNKLKNRKQDKKQKYSQVNRSLEQIITGKMAVQNADKSQYRRNSSGEKEANINDLKSTKRKGSLDEFASLKLDEYLSSKAEELEESSSSRSEEDQSEAEYNEFIDGMAEEGEEDTPSEDSNQIIDEGESIGYSSNEEVSDDDYDENDSFICDDEEQQLLSGEEYDLGAEKKKKKTKQSRIIDPNTLGDDDIIKIPEKEIEPTKKRSRIITVSDSSDEDQEMNDSVRDLPEPIIDKQSAENGKQDQAVNESVILIENSTIDNESINIIEESRTARPEKPIVEEARNKSATESPPITMEDSKIVDSVKQVPADDLEMMDSRKEVPVDQSYAKNSNDSIVTEESNNESSMSLSNLSANLHKRNRKSSLSIQENILVDGVKDPLITKRINDLVESFCSTVTQGEIALNLSLEFEDTSQEKGTKQVINVLSDIKIYPSQSIVSQEANEENQEVVDVQEETEPEQAKLSSSLEETGNLRENISRRNLKRRLSRSVADIQEEVMAAKRRKTHKIDKKKAASTAKISQPSTSNPMRRNKKDQVKRLKTVISSFSIMNQLVTDVKNRPKRTIKPTKMDEQVENTWTTTKVSNLKPSTSPMTKQEKIKVPQKLHPKDFRNQMLSDEKRVKRVDTKTVLKKKGAFY